jgi:hypothetical protein
MAPYEMEITVFAVILCREVEKEPADIKKNLWK